MSHTIPAVSQYMSSQAFTVGPLQTLQDARDMMVRARIHHLPVVDNGKLVGIVTSRDLDSAEHLSDGDMVDKNLNYEDLLKMVQQLPQAPAAVFRVAGAAPSTRT